LVKIGNFQGIRIPKAFIEKAKIEDCELDLNLVEQELPISTKQKTRTD
jgi:antitoxin component of MazEF toxin-antitoxin module